MTAERDGAGESRLDATVVARLGDWEVRCHATDERHRFAPQGSLQLQLYHPDAQASVFTPSCFTRGKFEIRRDGIRIIVAHWDDVVARLADLSPPRGIALAVLQTWMTVCDRLAALRRAARPALATS